MAAGARQRRITAPGALLTAVATAFFMWAALQLISHVAWPAPDNAPIARLNEIKVFHTLHRISTAQNTYKLQDWDGDGSHQYAQFYVHLWRSVDQQGRPIEVGLLPRDLACAMAPSRAVDGYYYTNLYHKQHQPSGPAQKMDYMQEWAVAAMPAKAGETGLLSMFIDQRGAVYAKKDAGAVTWLPVDPITEQWTQIRSAEALRAYQDTLDYSALRKP